MNNNIPDFQTLLLPILQLVRDNNTHNIHDVIGKIAKMYNLTEEEINMYLESGSQKILYNRVYWAKAYLKMAGLVENVARGQFRITDKGVNVLSQGHTYINVKFLKQIPGFSENLKGRKESPIESLQELESDKTPETILEMTIAELNSNLSYQLLEILKAKLPAQFEQFVLELLQGMGYGGVEEKNFEVTGQSGDFGIDGIIYQDKLGVERIYVQAKRWKDVKVSSKEIRDFIGSLSLRGTNKGVFITTSNFTEDAYKTSLLNPHNRIILIDGNKLANLAIEYNIGVQSRKAYYVKDIDADFFDNL
ncbi:MAG: restriction endonuclease [Sphingobacteriales bacterium]|nr:MAG: restriction endonuclease [Sphingobacteriales bacterium]